MLYLESLRDYVAIHTVDGRKVLTYSRSVIPKTVCGIIILSASISPIISFPKVATIEKSRVQAGRVELPIGDTYRERLKRLTGKN